MTDNTIIILDNNEDRKKSLISLFNEEKINAIDCKNISEFDELIDSSTSPLILVSYNSIVGAKRDEVISIFKSAKEIKVITYDVPSDATRHLAFYKMGSYRIFDTTYDSSEIFYFIKNLIAKSESDKSDNGSPIRGSLQDLSLAELIYTFGKEKRSGVLKIRSPFSSGKIFFNAGDIDDAISGYKKADDAILFMLTWTQGRFFMHPFPINYPKHRVKFSNIGLLLRGEQIRLTFLDKIRTLGSLITEVGIVNKGDLSVKMKDPQYKELIDRLTGYKRIQELIEISPYGIIETLDHLLELKGNNHLEIKEKSQLGIEELAIEESFERSGLEEPILDASEIENFRSNLKANEINTGKFLIIGAKTCGKTEFIRQFNRGSLSVVRSNQDLDFTKIELLDDFYLLVFGLSIDETLINMVKKLSDGLLGYTFLIDAQRSDDFEHINYLINQLTTAYKLPWSVAVTNIDSNDDKMLNKVSAFIQLPDNRKMNVCDVTNKDDVKKVILSVSPTV